MFKKGEIKLDQNGTLASSCQKAAWRFSSLGDSRTSWNNTLFDRIDSFTVVVKNNQVLNQNLENFKGKSVFDVSLFCENVLKSCWQIACQDDHDRFVNVYVQMILDGRAWYVCVRFKTIVSERLEP